MRFYGMSDRQLMEMPVTRFWLLNRSVDRIAAEESIRLAQVAGAVQSGDSYTTLMTALRSQMGKVMEIENLDQEQLVEGPDRAGLAALKLMAPVGSMTR